MAFSIILDFVLNITDEYEIRPECTHLVILSIFTTLLYLKYGSQLWRGVWDVVKQNKVNNPHKTLLYVKHTISWLPTLIR